MENEGTMSIYNEQTRQFFHVLERAEPQSTDFVKDVGVLVIGHANRKVSPHQAHRWVET